MQDLTIPNTLDSISPTLPEPARTRAIAAARLLAIDNSEKDLEFRGYSSLEIRAATVIADAYLARWSAAEKASSEDARREETRRVDEALQSFPANWRIERLGPHAEVYPPEGYDGFFASCGPFLVWSFDGIVTTDAYDSDGAQDGPEPLGDASAFDRATGRAPWSLVELRAGAGRQRELRSLEQLP